MMMMMMMMMMMIYNDNAAQLGKATAKSRKFKKQHTKRTNGDKTPGPSPLNLDKDPKITLWNPL